MVARGLQNSQSAGCVLEDIYRSLGHSSGISIREGRLKESRRGRKQRVKEGRPTASQKCHLHSAARGWIAPARPLTLATSGLHRRLRLAIYVS